MIRRKERAAQRAFTLIELLVVIAIIGLLASIVLVALNSARLKGRNATRVGDLQEVQTALELYYNDNNGYPNEGGGTWRSQCAGFGSLVASQVVWDTTLNHGLVPNYLPTFPSDPSMNTAADTSCFLYLSNGTDYKLLDYHVPDLPVTTVVASYPQFADPLRTSAAIAASFGCAYVADNASGSWGSLAVYSTGGACW